MSRRHPHAGATTGANTSEKTRLSRPPRLTARKHPTQPPRFGESRVGTGLAAVLAGDGGAAWVRFVPLSDRVTRATACSSIVRA